MRKVDTSKRPSYKETAKSMKKTLGSLRPYWGLIVLSGILLVGSVVISLTAPQIVRNLTNEIATGAVALAQGLGKINMDEVARYGITLAIMYAVSAICSCSASFIMTSVAEFYSKRLRTEITEKINRMPLRYFDSHKFGDVLSRLTNDVDTVSQSLRQSLANFFTAILTLTGAIIAMLITNWAMGLTVIASLPLSLLLVAMMGRLGMPQFRKRQHILGDINGTVTENYTGQSIIKAFGAEERVNAEFDAQNTALANASFLAEIFGGAMGPLANFISYVAYAAVCLVGGLLLVNSGDAAMMGTINAFLIYVNLFQSPMQQIAQSVNAMQSGAAASGRIGEFLAEEELLNETDKPRKLLTSPTSTIKGEVEFDHIRFGYEPTREIIHDFSAKVAPGSKVAIVGPTGAGKTTMVNLLMRFYETTGGDIKIDGVSIKDMPREEIHDIFGMVLQDTWVFEGTVKENLIYNTENVSDEKLQSVIKETHLRHYIKTLPGGVDYHIGGGAEISSGERQLLTIARAAIRKAPLLILDEATSNVDTRTEERIQKAMDSLTEGRTSFVIAHRLSTIKNADLILVMDGGNIVEQGTHDSLMAKNGFYASLYNSQFAFE